MAQITYLGHSSFKIITNGVCIVTDPFIKSNDLAIKAGVDLLSLKPDYILVSHGHEDHTADLLELAMHSGAKVICIWEIHAWLQKQGVTNTHPMNIGGKWDFGPFSVKMTQAVHSSSFPDGSYAGSPAGFVVWNDQECFYYSGDTALFSDMRMIGEDFDLDFCFLPIGDNFTMDIRDACSASSLLSCNQIFGMHYDTFGFIVINLTDAIEHFKSNGKELLLPAINQEFNI